MSKMHPISVLLILIALSFFSLQVSALSYIYKTLVAPIVKDPETSLYSITLNSRENYVIDISAPLSWRLCQNPESPVSPVPCSSPQCIQARSFLSSKCRPADNIMMRNGQCHCIVTPVNSVANSCAVDRLSYTKVNISRTNGKNPTGITSFNKLYFSCAPKTLFKSLPQGVSGLAALSRAPPALSSQLSLAYKGLTNKVSICLPSGNRATGASFFGNGPYYFRTTGFVYSSLYDLTNSLLYTPLLKKPNSVEYFVGLEGISINGKSSKFQPYAFALGRGGVKLSTVAPYTILRSDIYKIVLNDFSRAAKGIPQVKNVSPFGLCFKASAMGWSMGVLKAPSIELDFGSNKWKINGANSMKEVGGNVACLAFVDGGKTAKEAVVIGSYQMENNFIQFDLARSRLGFSSLHAFRSSCANFNFTTAV